MEEYQEKLKQLLIEMEKLAPNRKAPQKLEEISAQLEGTKEKFAEIRKTKEGIDSKFNKIKEKRVETFMRAYEEIEKKNIDKVYKELTESNRSSASLMVESNIEPYKEGIRYSPVPYGDRFRTLDQLSGGQKTIAALALLFAIQRYKPSPFFVLDEVDAHLDSQGTSKLARYIKKHSDSLQWLVISLNDQFFSTADALVGVFKDKKREISGTLTLDLSQFTQA